LLVRGELCAQASLLFPLSFDVRRSVQHLINMTGRCSLLRKTQVIEALEVRGQTLLFIELLNRSLET